ncbi:MAG: hypothetical protein AB7I19_04680 [Planctomycetota bacterium]
MTSHETKTNNKTSLGQESGKQRRLLPSTAKLAKPRSDPLLKAFDGVPQGPCSYILGAR